MTSATLARSRKSIVEGEFVMTADDFRCIAKLIHTDAGIALPDHKSPLVYSRIAKRLRALNLTNFAEYCELLQSAAGAEERVNLLTSLTTNVTRFFREPHHFEHLAQSILPAAIHTAKRGGRVRIWSSACSSGQEPYSIALTILRLLPEAPNYDIRILATDIDPNIVADGRRGIYDAQLVKDIPPDLRRRWLVEAETEPGAFSMATAARALVEFRNLNLIRPWPMQGTFQAIFCRNVMIYFDASTQAQVWAKMVPLLDGDGALYIGHSERVIGSALEKLRPDGITTYRCVAGPPGRRAP